MAPAASTLAASGESPEAQLRALQARIDGLSEELVGWTKEAQSREGHREREAEDVVHDLEVAVKQLRTESSALGTKAQRLRAAIEKRDDEIEQLTDACEWQLDGVMA